MPRHSWQSPRKLRSSANDDTYIYFNYAKNLVAGRPFAYDPRNIASEGFTSAIYLLLLVPLEAAGINMMFAAVILNLAAIALIIYLGYQVLRADRVLEGGYPVHCRVTVRRVHRSRHPYSHHCGAWPGDHARAGQCALGYPSSRSRASGGRRGYAASRRDHVPLSPPFCRS